MAGPAGFNIPPLEIKLSDLDISPDHPEYQNAIKALKGYWSQATVMTKEEQEEYRDLLVIEEAYCMSTSAHKPSGHKIYHQIQRHRTTWPRWVLLLSLYGRIRHLEPIIMNKLGSSKFDDLTSSYEAFFSTDLPEIISQQAEETENHVKFKELKEIKRHNGNEVTVIEQPSKRDKGVERYKNDFAETAARSSTKRLPSSTDLSSNKRQLIGTIEFEEQLLASMATRSAQRAEEGMFKLEKRVGEMEKKLDQLVGTSKEILVALRDNKNLLESLMAPQFGANLEEKEFQLVDEADELYMY
jgi:hypothetical protein